MNSKWRFFDLNLHTGFLPRFLCQCVNQFRSFLALLLSPCCPMICFMLVGLYLSTHRREPSLRSVVRTNVGTFRHLRCRSQTRLAILRARSLSKLSRERCACSAVLRVTWFTRHLLAGTRNFFDSCTFWSCILYTKFWSLFKLRKELTLSWICSDAIEHQSSWT